jgi:hypothetical protein
MTLYNCMPSAGEPVVARAIRAAGRLCVALGGGSRDATPSYHNLHCAKLRSAAAVLERVKTGPICNSIRLNLTAPDELLREGAKVDFIQAPDVNRPAIETRYSS